MTEDGDWDREFLAKTSFFPCEDDKALGQSPRAVLTPSALGVFRISQDSL